MKNRWLLSFILTVAFTLNVTALTGCGVRRNSAKKAEEAEETAVKSTQKKSGESAVATKNESSKAGSDANESAPQTTVPYFYFKGENAKRIFDSMAELESTFESVDPKECEGHEGVDEEIVETVDEDTANGIVPEELVREIRKKNADTFCVKNPCAEDIDGQFFCQIPNTAANH